MKHQNSILFFITCMSISGLTMAVDFEQDLLQAYFHLAITRPVMQTFRESFKERSVKQRQDFEYVAHRQLADNLEDSLPILLRMSADRFNSSIDNLFRLISENINGDKFRSALCIDAQEASAKFHSARKNHLRQNKNRPLSEVVRQFRKDLFEKKLARPMWNYLLQYKNEKDGGAEILAMVNEARHSISWVDCDDLIYTLELVYDSKLSENCKTLIAKILIGSALEFDISAEHEELKAIMSS